MTHSCHAQISRLESRLSYSVRQAAVHPFSPNPSPSTPYYPQAVGWPRCMRQRFTFAPSGLIQQQQLTVPTGRFGAILSLGRPSPSHIPVPAFRSFGSNISTLHAPHPPFDMYNKRQKSSGNNVATGLKRTCTEPNDTSESLPTHQRWATGSVGEEEGEEKKVLDSPSQGDEVIHSEKSLLNMLNSLRQWNLTDSGLRQLEKAKPGQEFSVMSYNILAQCLLEDNIYLYTNSDPDVLQWDYRKAQLLREFQEANADILCLQEIQCDHFDDFFVPQMELLGYTGHYKKRTGNKHDGCATFYKKDVFSLEQVVGVEYCHPGLGILDRDNIALLAVLRDKSGQKLCVANTHLLFNPGRGDIKLAQLRILLAEIDKHAFQSGSKHAEPYLPVILCGDLNSEPHCPLYQLVSAGRLRYEGLVAGDVSGQGEGYFRGRFPLDRELVPPTLGISDRCQYVKSVAERSGKGGASSSFNTGRMSHSLNLVSSYGHCVSRSTGRKKEVTTHHSKCSCTVDYIFYSVVDKSSLVDRGRVINRNVLEGRLVLLGTYGLLTADEMSELGGLPNAASPSDHLPLIAKFLLSVGT